MAGEGPVIVAYDGSPAARQAIVEAAKILRSRTILVVTVWEKALAHAGRRSSAHEVQQRAEGVSHEGAALARSLGLDAEPLALPNTGDVAETILTRAREQQAPAIVVGSRGLTGIRARLEGSTSRALLQHAPCPVIVVHEVDAGQDSSEPGW